MSEKISRREQLLKELQDLEDAKSEEPEDLEIEISKDAAVKKMEKVEVQPVTKQKKPRSEAQLKVFERAKETARINAEKRKAEREVAAEQERKLLEEKLVKKAISVKKKQIKAQAVLDEISDDDTDMVEIEKIAKKLPGKKAAVSATVESKPVVKPPTPYIFF